LSTANVTLQCAGVSESSAAIGAEVGDDVLEAWRPAHLRHLLAEPGLQALEVVAVAGQRPHLAGAEVERGPAEHGAVERLRPLDVARVQAVEVHGAVLVDDPCALLRPRLPDREHGALGVGQDRHPP
jgi:hypothetical protein